MNRQANLSISCRGVLVETWLSQIRIKEDIEGAAFSEVF
jgi:hypothetical protein